MFSVLRASNPAAADMVADPSPHISAICPRRAGKTYAAVLAALITGEAKPNSITLIISLNKKQLKRLYWAGGPSGLFTLAHKFGLNLEYNGTDLRWEHENGSIGYLLGADDDEQLEVIRGLEADLYIIDECKSFAPFVLAKLIDDIIDPQRASRSGRLMLIGTPGFNPTGPFWQATCPTARDSDGKPYLVGINTAYAKCPRVDADGRTPVSDLLWSCHHWTLADNTAMPHQWVSAQVKKRQKKWTDVDPTWCREYLGEWASGGAGLVYLYGDLKGGGDVTWLPDYADGNQSGLPPEGAPWRFIGGLDIGYEAPTALVIAAYSQRLGQLRHVVDIAKQHLLVGDIGDLIEEAQAKYGRLEVVYCDKGNLGKTIVETLVRDRGLPLEAADKREKNDYVELLNSAFANGEVKIIENTTLEAQLLTNAWKLPDERPETQLELARRGKLKEDDAIPNDVADAFLYLYRGSLHRFGPARAPLPEDENSAEFQSQISKRQIQKYRAQLAREAQTDRLGDNRMTRAPSFVRRALDPKRWQRPLNSSR